MIQTTPTTSNQPSVGTLLKDLADDTRTLLRQEVQLAKVEMSEKVSKLARNAAYLAIGAIVLHTGVLALIAAACIGLYVILAQNMDPEIALWLGPLIVGVIVAIVGYAFVQKAISTFRNEALVPEKTIETMRENKEWLKDQMTTSDQTTSVNRMT